LVIPFLTWWVIRTLLQIQSKGEKIENDVRKFFERVQLAPPSKPAGEDVASKLKDAAKDAAGFSAAIKAAGEELRNARQSLDGLIKSIKDDKASLDACQREFQELRENNPILARKVVDLERERDEIQAKLDEEKVLLTESKKSLLAEQSTHALKLSGLETQISEKSAELFSARGDIARLAGEAERLGTVLRDAESQRDAGAAENNLLRARVSSLELELAKSLSEHEAFVDWLLSRELRDAFADEVAGLLTSRSAHELLAALALLKDAGSQVCEETVVLSNIRHLGTLLVQHYRAQGLDAGQRDVKLRQWADFVNSKAAGHAQVIVPGLRFPVNAAVMVAPDGVKVISDVHCWQVNNVKGVVYAPAKVS
jgi:septal ring factor EnvC (AmiA/AmiB activator)